MQPRDDDASARMTTPAERRPYAERLRAALAERHG
jgi:hypothetical protein